MKKNKVLFWIPTILLFLFEGVMPALTSHTDLAKQGVMHLGYPEYFVTLLTVFKVLGALVLILPQISPRIKEWAYAGFMINFLSAFISLAVVDGWNPGLILPVVCIGLLIMSYTYYHKISGGIFNRIKAVIQS